MNDWVWLGIVSILILSSGLVLVSLFLWLQVRRKYLLWWTFGWGLYSLHFIFVLIYEFRAEYCLLNILGDSMAAFSMIFLLLGLLEFCQSRFSRCRWLWAIPVIDSLWSIFWNFRHNSQLGNAPTAISFGIIQLLMGVILFKIKPALKYNSNRVLGCSMLLWGLHKFDRPFIRYVPQLAPAGFFIGAIFAFITAVFMLILIVEQTSQERDITKERFSILFKNINDIIVFFGLNGEIIDANQAAIEKYGYSREELLGMNVFQLHDGTDNHNNIKQQIAEANQKGILFETRHYCKGGFSFPVEVHGMGATIGEQRVVVCIIRDITERKKTEAELREMNYTDKLTGLRNRAYLTDNSMKLDIEENFPCGVIIGDVNGLKFVNDAFGHRTGDVLLQEIARLLLDSCRKEDLVIRWGGDEFLMILPHADVKLLENLCQMIQQECRESRLLPIQPSIALGYALKEFPDQDNLEIFKIADDRMYRNKLLTSKSSRNVIISSLQTALFERSYETEEHAERLKIYALQMGQLIGLPSNQMDDLALLATLHDVGKVAIPEEIILKPGPLSPEEWETMKRHPGIGYRIVQAVPDLAHIAEAILAHHERWDGTGYPQGLREEEIPLIARIITIVDSYDAMTSRRIYHEACSHEEAMAEICRCAGSQFDPHLVTVFSRCF